MYLSFTNRSKPGFPTSASIPPDQVHPARRVHPLFPTRKFPPKLHSVTHVVANHYRFSTVSLAFERNKPAILALSKSSSWLIEGRLPSVSSVLPTSLPCLLWPSIPTKTEWALTDTNLTSLTLLVRVCPLLLPTWPRTISSGSLLSMKLT